MASSGFVDAAYNLEAGPQKDAQLPPTVLFPPKLTWAFHGR